MKARDILQRLAPSQRLDTPGSINLSAREGCTKDIADCHALHRSLGIPYPEEERRRVPEVWRTLFSTGALQLFVVEDQTHQRGAQILSFTGTVFVTDSFCSQAKTTLPPYLCVRLAQHHSARDLPVLNREQVSRANAHDGLCCNLLRRL